MRKYNEHQEEAIISIVCNACGKPIQVERGIIKEGVCSVDCVWGYFSKKDGSRHVFDLCEECYDKIIKEFALPVEQVDENELL